MSDELDTLSDVQLDELFAVEVAGLEHRHAGSRMWCKRGSHICHGLPSFSTNASLALTWLGNSYDISASDVGPIRVRVKYYGYATGVIGEAVAPTFPRAAVIALIRAKRAQKGAS